MKLFFYCFLAYFSIAFHNIAQSRSIQDIENEEEQQDANSTSKKAQIVNEANNITHCAHEGARIALILYEEGNLISYSGYNALFEEINRRLSMKGLLTISQAEINQKIHELRSQKQTVRRSTVTSDFKSAAAAAETKAYLEGKSAVEILSISSQVIHSLKAQANRVHQQEIKRVEGVNANLEKKIASLKPVFALKTHVNARYGFNQILGVRQVVVTMDFDLINSEGRIISTYKMNEGSYSNFDVDGAAMRLVEDNADIIVAHLYKAICFN